MGHGLPVDPELPGPQYATDALAPAGSNTTFYSNTAFDAASPPPVTGRSASRPLARL